MTTEQKHARGPWSLCYDGQIDDADGSLVVRLPFDSYKEFNDQPERVKANWRLMTRAPQLLEMLLEIKQHGLSWDDRYDAVISKLTGAA